MSDVNVAPTPASPEPVAQPVQPDINAQLGNSMWNENFTPPQPTAPEATPPAVEQPVVPSEPTKPEPKIVEVNDWIKETFNVDNVDAAKAEWERLRQLQQQAQTPQEIKYANEEARKYHEAILGGKSDELYNILHQQRQLTRLEQLEIKSAAEAAEIIKANLQFKHRDLKPEQIERLYTRQYDIPAKPIQMGEDDTEYAAIVADWQRQVQEKEQDIMIDAQIAKPELLKYKSELVLPDIPKVDPQPQGLSPEDLAKVEAQRNNFMQHLERDFNKFTGFSVTAKDGGVELPIAYGVTPDELNASKQDVQNLNINQFLDSHWFDAQGNPNIKLIQEDLYLLKNRDKVFQKIANEASAQRALHETKVRNNINLNGVNPGTAQPAGVNAKTESQELAEKVWGIN